MSPWNLYLLQSQEESIYSESHKYLKSNLVIAFALTISQIIQREKYTTAISIISGSPSARWPAALVNYLHSIYWTKSFRNLPLETVSQTERNPSEVLRKNKVVSIQALTKPRQCHKLVDKVSIPNSSTRQDVNIHKRNTLEFCFSQVIWQLRHGTLQPLNGYYSKRPYTSNILADDQRFPTRMSEKCSKLVVI